MKIAVICDTHYGVKNSSKHFLNHMVDFTEKVFFPEIEKRGITEIYHLGDLGDNRSKFDINVAKVMRETFFEKCQGKNVYMIPGNHDCYFKDSIKTNTMIELAEHYNNVNVIMKPTEINDILMIPWICEENEKEILDYIKNTKSHVCFGHFDIKGFELYKGRVSEVGLSPSVFQKFDVVASGHYHHRSKSGNIHYLGNPYQITWNDWGDERGFSVFDTETREFEFIENPVTIYEKIIYNGIDTSILKSYENKYVKVIVKDKTDPYKLERFVNKIENMNPIEVRTIEDVLDIGVNDSDKIVETAESINELFSNYIDTFNFDLNKDELKKFINDLYQEASLVTV